MSLKTCIYCGLDKDEGEFSLEHIWPDALGGDFLDDFWKTDEVCQKCNGMSGVFVDGAFIKSWMGSAERTQGAREYLSLENSSKGAFPLHCMGPLPDVETRPGETIEFWLGPCGEYILHFRPEDKEELWASYAGGDPRKGSKKSRAGRAYLTFTSEEPFWVLVALKSFKLHFNCERYIVNADVRDDWTAFKKPDRSNEVQAADLAVVESIREVAANGKFIRARPAIHFDLGNRFLAKVALGTGYKTFGKNFLETECAKALRQGFREVDPKKRQNIEVKGSGLFSPAGLGGAEEIIKWPGAWVLFMVVVEEKLTLGIVTPAGKSMNVLVCDDANLVGKLDKMERDGRIWLTIPALGEAMGPISFPQYLAHQTRNISVPALTALAAKRIDPSSLPPCRPLGGSDSIK
jgi:hypothetical protein